MTQNSITTEHLGELKTIRSLRHISVVPFGPGKRYVALHIQF